MLLYNKYLNNYIIYKYNVAIYIRIWYWCVCRKTYYDCKPMIKRTIDCIKHWKPEEREDNKMIK